MSISKPKFDFSGLRKNIEGLRMTAVFTNGSGEVTSYIGFRKRRKVYGYYNYQTAQYDEQPFSRP